MDRVVTLTSLHLASIVSRSAGDWCGDVVGLFAQTIAVSCGRYVG
jgi:hypothetical protein